MQHFRPVHSLSHSTITACNKRPVIGVSISDYIGHWDTADLEALFPAGTD